MKSMIRRHLVYDSTECALLCMRNSNCLSFNIEDKETSTRRKFICELNDDTKHNMLFVEDSGYFYYELIPAVKQGRQWRRLAMSGPDVVQQETQYAEDTDNSERFIHWAVNAAMQRRELQSLNVIIEFTDGPHNHL